MVIYCISLLQFIFFDSYMTIDQPILGEMLVKLMTSESEKSHGSMMLRLSDMGRTKGG